MSFLYHAEPCDETDPAPGIRLKKGGNVLGRLSPREAAALAGDLLAAAIPGAGDQQADGPARGDGAERVKPDYPVLLIRAWKAAGSVPRASQEDERLAADWAAIGDLIVWDAGHNSCGGWTYDPATQRLACACGTDLFEMTGVPA